MVLLDYCADCEVLKKVRKGKARVQKAPSFSASLTESGRYGSFLGGLVSRMSTKSKRKEKESEPLLKTKYIAS